jgi:hypothetical protein
MEKYFPEKKTLLLNLKKENGIFWLYESAGCVNKTLTETQAVCKFYLSWSLTYFHFLFVV